MVCKGENERGYDSGLRKHTVSKPSNPGIRYKQRNSKMEAKPVWAVLQALPNNVPF